LERGCALAGLGVGNRPSRGSGWAGSRKYVARRWAVYKSLDASVVTALLVLVVIGLPLLGLLAELALLDTRRSKAVADAALRRAMESPDPRLSPFPPVGMRASGAGAELGRPSAGPEAGGQVEKGSLAAGPPQPTARCSW
jgi:hypothetical protein